MLPLKWELRLSQKCLFIDVSTHDQIVLISETEKGAKGKIAERLRESEGEREHWEAADVASVVKQTVRKYTC